MGNRVILGLLVTKEPFVLKVLLCLEGQECVEGHLHKWLANYANLVQGVVSVLDPEYGKLEPGHRYLGNGFGPANCATDVVNFTVAQLREGLFGLQELFLIEARHHGDGEAKHILIPKEKIRLCVCVAGHCKRGVGTGVRGVDKGPYQSSIDGSTHVVVAGRGVIAVVVLSLSGAESYGSHTRRR